MTDLATRDLKQELLARFSEEHEQHLRLEAPPDEVAEWVGKWAVAKRLLRAVISELDDIYKDRFVEWLQGNGDLTVGDTRYYPGKKTDEKCRDVAAAFDSALTLTGGDVERIVPLLSTDALKAGACAKEFGPEWRAEHFEKTVKLEPKTGKPKKVPVMVNTKYLPAKEKK